MPINVTKLTDDQLKNFIENHRRHKATSAPVYLEALRELQIRKGNGLEFDKSFRIIKAAAKEGRFLSYKDLADASGADWNSVLPRSPLTVLWNILTNSGISIWPNGLPRADTMWICGSSIWITGQPASASALSS
jgi:hypothetical protein